RSIVTLDRKHPRSMSGNKARPVTRSDMRGSSLECRIARARQKPEIRSQKSEGTPRANARDRTSDFRFPNSDF
ncbi:MAG TPA: hypothetical protein VLW75_01440, partial [Rhizomicrobium sp.]|nr:hypothetical protein [Rhizomicrobium sp.]